MSVADSGGETAEFDVVPLLLPASLLPLQVELFNGTQRSVPERVRHVADLRGSLEVWCGGRLQGTVDPGSGSPLLIPWLPPHDQLPVVRAANASGLLTKAGVVLLPVRDRGHQSKSTGEDCEMRQLAAWEQRSWPVAKLFGTPRPQRKVPLWPADADGRGSDLSWLHVFDVGRSRTHPCEGGAGSVAAAIAAERGSEPVVSSFLQVQGLTKIVNSAVKMASSVVLDRIEGASGRHIQQVINSDTTQALAAMVPPQVLALATAPMKINTSNLIVDAVSYELTEGLARSLTNALGPKLEESVAQALIPQLHAAMQAVVSKSASKDLGTELPVMVERGALLRLAPHLTKSITHATVAGLTMSLGVARHVSNEMFCHACYYQQLHCTECRSSSTDLYYTTYYSAYYSGYYSDFYSQYYVDAVRLMDEQDYPDAPAHKKEREKKKGKKK